MLASYVLRDIAACSSNRVRLVVLSAGHHMSAWYHDSGPSLQVRLFEGPETANQAASALLWVD